MQNNKTLKTLILNILILFAVLSSLYSCNKEKTEKLVDSGEPLQWYINFPWYTGKWGQDIVTQTVTEMTGISAEFIIPAGNANEKLNTMIVSESLPDLITIGWWEDAAKKLQNSYYTYNLEELAEKYEPLFMQVSDKGKRDWYRQEDGGVYGYPNASYSPLDYEDENSIFSNDTFLVRKDMYEAIGSPNMSTPEGFINALKMAKEKFATVDGAKMYPIGFSEIGSGEGTLGDYLQNFLAIPDVKDNKIYDRNVDKEYLRWLKTLRDASNEGLISKDVFSDTRQQIEEKITQGRYFALLYPYIDALQPLTNRYQADPNSSYIAIDGPKNSRGDQHELSGPGISGWTITMISKNSKNPEKAIKLLTFLISEKGKEVAFLGKKGVTWDMIDGKAAYLPEYAEMRENDRPRFDKEAGADWLLWMAMDTAYQFKKWPIPAPESYRSLRDWTKGKIKSRLALENIDPLASSELGIAQGKINGKFAEMLPKLILSKNDAEFDSIVKEYIEFRDKNNYKELVDYRTKKYLEHKEKLGM